MHKLTMNEICSVSGGDFNLYQDPIIPERVLLAPPPPVLVPWPICSAQLSPARWSRNNKLFGL